MAGDFHRTSALAPLPWDRGRAEKEARAMFASTALKPVAAALAGAHPRALDYIRQAPVIVLAAAAGRPHRMNGKRLRTALHESLGARCRRGERLRDVMAAYGCTGPLRALRSNVLALNQWRVICMLRAMAPSRLAPIIPKETREQQAWLRALMIWVDHCLGRGARVAAERWFEWAAGALSRCRGSDELVVTEVADLFIAASATDPAGNARVDPSWTFPQARAAALRWHLAMQREAQGRMYWAGDVRFVDAKEFEDRVDYGPLQNDPFMLVGFEVVPLRSKRDLYEEGAVMHHCVGSYSHDVRIGKSRIFSVRRSGRRVATVEIGIRHGGPFLAQARGPCNAMPAQDVMAVARAIEQDARSMYSALPSKQRLRVSDAITVTGPDGTDLLIPSGVTVHWEEQGHD